jgi:hypothetical protein
MALLSPGAGVTVKSGFGLRAAGFGHQASGRLRNVWGNGRTQLATIRVDNLVVRIIEMGSAEESRP